jgi:hypothetical protein
MKRSIFILVLGLAVGAAAFCAPYLSTTANERAAMRSDQPELWWLKQEFHLSDAEFRRISQLHEGYLPKCQELCARIASKNAELRTIFAKTDHITPDIEEKLAEVAQLRAECQRNMLAHFLAVSRAMTPDEGRRYLGWVAARTLPGDDSGMPMPRQAAQ